MNHLTEARLAQMQGLEQLIRSLHSSFQDAMDGAEISLTEIADFIRDALTHIETLKGENARLKMHAEGRDELDALLSNWPTHRKTAPKFGITSDVQGALDELEVRAETAEAQLAARDAEVKGAWHELGKSYQDSFSDLPTAIKAAAKRVREAEEHANVADYNTGFEMGRKHGDATARLTAIRADAAEANVATQAKEIERLTVAVAELEGWNDAALDRERELQVERASLAERVKELEGRVAKRTAVTTAQTVALTEVNDNYASEFNRAENAEAEVTRLTEELEDSGHALATTSAGLTRHIQRWQALKEWAGKPDTSIDVGAHGLPEVKRIIRELEAQP